MLVADLRRRVLEKVEQAATGGDEDSAATALAHARAGLVALARHREDEDLTLQNLAVGTGTAALILGLHPEYVRVAHPSGFASGNQGECGVPHSAVCCLRLYGHKEEFP